MADVGCIGGGRDGVGRAGILGAATGAPGADGARVAETRGVAKVARQADTAGVGGWEGGLGLAHGAARLGRGAASRTVVEGGRAGLAHGVGRGFVVAWQAGAVGEGDAAGSRLRIDARGAGGGVGRGKAVGGANGTAKEGEVGQSVASVAKKLAGASRAEGVGGVWLAYEAGGAVALHGGGVVGHGRALDTGGCANHRLVSTRKAGSAGGRGARVACVAEALGKGAGGGACSGGLRRAPCADGRALHGGVCSHGTGKAYGGALQWLEETGGASAAGGLLIEPAGG